MLTSTQVQKIPLTNLWANALKEGKALALWRLPHHTQKNFIIDLEGKIKQQKIDIETQAAGFIISPFINPNNENTYFIQSDLHFYIEKNECIRVENPIGTQNTALQELFLKQCTKHHKIDNPIIEWNNNQKYPTINPALQQQKYCKLVEKGIKAIEANHFQKVVLSRYKAVQLPISFDVLETFDKICETYPAAFVYLWYLPQVGFWLGASPEILISIDKDLIFRTVSLAGTQAFLPNIKLSKVSWTQKEIEEQALVSRYIINCFKKVRLREFEEEGPKTVVAGNLMHLKTFFKVDMQATNFGQLGSVMLDLLHPTSAVCGMPKQEALAFILAEEQYDRSFYSGFVGTVNMDKESHIFVNLRCMQLLDGQAILYAGAGITEDSEPEKEWKETEMKCDTMLKMIS